MSGTLTQTPSRYGAIAPPQRISLSKQPRRPIPAIIIGVSNRAFPLNPTSRSRICRRSEEPTGSCLDPCPWACLLEFVRQFQKPGLLAHDPRKHHADRKARRGFAERQRDCRVTGGVLQWRERRPFQE